jgi:hypothetical protein
MHRSAMQRTAAIRTPCRPSRSARPRSPNNDFQSTDLSASQFNFKETTFTIRNRGNTDTTVSFKLLLRDAACTAGVCTPPKDANGNPLYKLQLIVRKVALVPVPIPPTGPATGDGRRDLRIGFAQMNTEVSNITDLPLIDPNDTGLGQFKAIDAKAAMLSLGAGEFAYATIRAIGLSAGFSPPDPAELLQWGVQTVPTKRDDGDEPVVHHHAILPVAAVRARYGRRDGADFRRHLYRDLSRRSRHRGLHGQRTVMRS